MDKRYGRYAPVILLLLLAGCWSENGDRVKVHAFREREVLIVPSGAEIHTKNDLILVEKNGYYIIPEIAELIKKKREEGKMVRLVLLDPNESFFVPYISKPEPENLIRVEWEDDLFYIEAGGLFFTPFYGQETMETKVK